MQTTLLSLAITIILALMTALVAPLFIDWTRYRSELEAYASRVSGLEIHVTGPIDARLLPTPTLVMQGIEIARADGSGSLRARALRVEFQLGALVRGEWRVSEARLQGPEITAGLDHNGGIMGSLPKLRLDTQAIAIERLNVEDGRAILTYAETGSRLAIEKIEFRGELRSLSGPLKGEGSFVAAGLHFPYRVSASPVGQDNAAKVRFTVDPIERQLAAELELTVSVDRGIPHFAGQLQLYRSVGRATAGSQSPIVEPWRLTARVAGDSASAEVEQIEFQYGPDERSAKLRGSARVKLGSHPRILASMSSPQIDLDGLALFSEGSRRQPLEAIKLIGTGVLGTLRLPVPTVLNIELEALGLAGATLQRVNAELESENENWVIRKLDFRAPGASEIQLSGSLSIMSSAPRFAGSVKLQTGNPRALAAWLGAAGDEQISPSGPLRFDADVTASGDAIDIQRLRLDLDRTSVTGHFGYAWGSKKSATRLDAALVTSEVDLDQVFALAKPLFAKRELAWPGQGALSLKAERALLLGVQAKHVDVNVRIDSSGLQIDPLIISDFGGAALAARGRIDTAAKSTGGAVTLDLDAHNLEGVLAVLDKFAPATADQVRRYGSRLTPVVLRASVTVAPGAGSGRLADCKLKADGRAGAFRVALLGDLAGASGPLDIAAPVDLSAANVNLIGRVETDDGATLIDLLRLDRIIAVDKQPGRLAVTAKGPLHGEIEFGSRLSVGPLDAAANGRVYVWPRGNPRAELAVAVRNANFRSPRPVIGEGAVDPMPASFTVRVALADRKIDVTDLKGTFAGESINGRLAIGMQHPLDVQGELDLGGLNLPAALAAVLGIPIHPPHVSSTAQPLWPSEPFTQPLGQPSGQIFLKAARLTVMPNVDVQHFKGMLRFGEGRIALQVIEGAIAGGPINGELVFLHEGEALIARTRVRVIDASAADLLPGNGIVSGKIRFELTAEGTGMSVLALVGSLDGRGTFTIENARVARLDPKAFEIVTRAVDQGLAIDPDRLRERVDAALAGGVLLIPRAEGAIAISGGQARVTNSMVGERGTELALNGSMSFIDREIDARLVLSRADAPEAGAKAPAEIEIGLKGPLSAPKRSIGVGKLANWLALRAVDQAAKKLDVLEHPEQASAPTDHAEQPPADKKQQHPAETAGSTAAPHEASHRRAAKQRTRPPAGEPQPAPPPSSFWPNWTRPQSLFGGVQ
ncbi:MAG TPA: AsmA-like C-terminal region-containing protein [Xanthobacteraceae bacterium]